MLELKAFATKPAIFTFYHVCLCVCLHMGVSAHGCDCMWVFTQEYVCPWRPEAFDSQKAGVTGGCDPRHLGAGD